MNMSRVLLVKSRESADEAVVFPREFATAVSELLHFRMPGCASLEPVPFSQVDPASPSQEEVGRQDVR